MKTISGLTTTTGTSNVFADLGFNAAEARNLHIRSQLMTALRKFIEKEGLTQADAAKRLRVSQPRIRCRLEVDFRIKPSTQRVA
jgi:predicted XRE-type DNA-binding protein